MYDIHAQVKKKNNFAYLPDFIIEHLLAGVPFLAM